MIYTNGGYAIGFGVAFGLWTMSEFIGPVRWGRTREGKRRDSGSIILGFLFGTAGVLLAVCSPLIWPGANLPTGAFFVGVGVLLLGIGWRWYAITTLGKFFTATVIIHKDQSVIRHGPYKFCRHPSYAGFLFVIAGLGCMIGNWVSLVFIIVGQLIPLLYRISIEEREMLSALGEEYRAYMSNTKWRLIPFIF